MTKKLSRIVALMLAVIMSFSMLLVPVEAASFKDVSNKAWYKAAVDYVAERGWMSGVSSTTFAPNMKVTRGMAVTVLAKVAEADLSAYEPAFADTEAGKWYTKAAAWAADKGIVAGVGDGMFAPNRVITRQDLAAILNKFIKKQDYQITLGEPVSFNDMDSVAGYATEAVSFCAAAGLVSGFEDSTFRPQQTATRAQLAVMMMKLDQLIQGYAQPMPAQSFNGEAGEDMVISVNAPEGALPEDTEMALSRVIDEDALEILAAKAKTDVIAAADISFIKNGTEIEPNAAVEVQLALEGLENVENPAIVHVNSNGNLECISSELVSTTRGGSKALRFMAKDFSVYAVVDGGVISEYARLLVRFFDADNATTPVYSVYVTKQDKDMLMNVIEDPEIPQATGYAMFCGWSVGNEYTTDDVDGEHDIDYIRDQVKARLNQNVKEGDTFDVYAMIYNCFPVTFKDENKDTIITSKVFYTKDSSYTFTIDESYTPYLGNYRFTGWKKDDAADTKHYDFGEEITVNKPTVLTAQVQKGYWITFNERPARKYKGADYNPPVFCVDGLVTPAKKPTNPTLDGYTFKGWYKQYDENTDTWSDGPYEFNETITKELTLYAKWELNETTKYTITFYRQKVTLDGYDFVADEGFQNPITIRNASPNAIANDVQISGTGNNAVAVINGTTYGFTGFHCADYDDDVTILPNGTANVNVYFDRNEYTFTFRVNYRTIHSFTRKYGEQIVSDVEAEDEWTFTGTNGTKYPEDGHSSWNPTTNNPINGRISKYPYMPAANITFDYYRNTQNRERYFYYYVTALDDSEDKVTINGKEYVLRTDLKNDFNIVRWAADFWVLNGFERDDITDSNGVPVGVTETTEKNWNSISLSSGATPNTLYFLYDRLSYAINYQDGSYFDGNGARMDEVSRGQLKLEEGIPFESKLSTYNKGGANYYVPEYDGFVFAGWYTDKGCNTPYTFSEMPENGITVYAKWQQVEYRVFLDLNNTNSDFTPILNGQDLNFRVTYGEMVSNGQKIVIKAQDGLYELVGWYKEPACKNIFSFTSRVDESNTVAYDKENTPTEANGTNGDLDRFWITKKLVIYAKWRKVMKDTNGVNLKYDAVQPASGDNAAVPGHFDGNETIWLDRTQAYVDQAKAIARTASTPDRPEDYMFDYWEIVDKTGAVIGTVHPGQSFTVEIDKALEEDAPTTVTDAYGDAAANGSQEVDTRSVSDPSLLTAEPTQVAFFGFESSESASFQYFNDDGDNYNWTIWDNLNDNEGVTGSCAAVSQSYINYVGALTPDNWLVTPAVQLPNSGINTFSLKAFGMDASWASEVFEVYISTSPSISSTADFTGSNGECIIAKTVANATSQEYSVELDQKYSGKTVYFAIRHYDVTDMYAIVVDDITVTNEKTNYTVTFVDWDGTVLKTQIVEPDAAAEAPADPTREGYRFTGWDPADFSHVNSDMTITAQYAQIGSYVVCFYDYDDRLISRQTVLEHGAAVEPERPTREGFVFKAWDPADFNDVTEDMDIYATYTKAVKKYYTLTLRAVYRPIPKLEKTHVTWYANNDAYAMKNSVDVYINEAFAIEDQVSFTELKNEGYTFLGWARLPEQPKHVHDYAPAFEDDGHGNPLYETYDDTDPATGEVVTKIKAYIGLTANDLWLVYHPADASKAQAYFTVREYVNGEYVELENSNDLNSFSQIAPNENMPYHGLYAVWSRDTFYVLHSSTGKMEAITMPVKSDGTEVEGVSYKVGQVNLTNYVQPGYLYGGYYVAAEDAQNNYYAYADVSHEAVQAAADAYTANTAAASWTAAAAASSDVSEANTVATTTMTAQNSQFKNYFGDYLYVRPNGEGVNKQIEKVDGTIQINKAVWNKKAAQTASGKALAPKPGMVYYLKEVPSSYLASKIIYSYDTQSEDKTIKDIWLISLLDDGSYDKNGTGFTVNGELVKRTSVSLTFTVVQQSGTTNPSDQYVTVKAANFKNVNGGVVMVAQMESVPEGAFNMVPCFTTPDGVKVSNNGVNFTPNTDRTDEKNLYTWTRHFDGTEKMYFDMDKGAGLGTLKWTDGDDDGNKAIIAIHFFNSETHKDLVATKVGIGNIHSVTVPAGDWTKFIIVRCNETNFTLNNIFGSCWNQTGDIPINKDTQADPNQNGSDLTANANLVDWFTTNQDSENYAHVHWGYFPVKPS